MTDATPQWQLLPSHPQKFFGLNDQFDRKDLKRSYNLFIKQFKPEKHPAEFQRIREAYEQLDNQLRYGAPPPSVFDASSPYQWSVPEVVEPEAKPTWGESQPVEEADVFEVVADVDVGEIGTPAEAVPDQQRVPTPPRRKPLHERVLEEPIADLYNEFKAIERKQPYHYFALAVLSDGISPNDPQRFLKWVLAGVKQHPRDPALQQMLAAFTRGPIPAADIPRLLRSISQVVQDDRYFSLTESLWDRLLKEVPFAEFRKQLEACEANLSDFRLTQKLVFYIHLLKPALWVADADWTAAAFDLVEGNERDVPNSLEGDVEFLYLLRDYVQDRNGFLQMHPFRRVVDQTLRTCCESDEVGAERAFIACQVRMASSGQDLLDAFPLWDDSPGIDSFTILWHWLQREYFESAASMDDEEGPRKRRGARSILGEIEDRTDRTSTGRLWNLTAYLYPYIRFSLYPLLYCVIYFPLLWMFGTPSGGTGWMVILSLVIAGGGGFALNSIFASDLWGNWCFRMAKRCYNTVWRTHLLNVFSSTFVPYPTLLDRMDNFNDAEGQFSYRVWVVAFASRDSALRMYSYAQRYIA
ncbi:MAG: J domain-containing protein [Planctomycetaceae bacterium]